jgi:hypothetical protein
MIGAVANDAADKSGRLARKQEDYGLWRSEGNDVRRESHG